MPVSLHDVIEELYSTVLDEPAWEHALNDMHDYFRASGLTLFSSDPASHQVFRSHLVNLSHEVMADYAQNWLHQDPRHLAALRMAAGVSLTEEMTVGSRAFRRSAVYSDFIRPLGLPFHMAAWIVRTPQRGVIVSFQRSATQGPYGEHEREDLNHLLPHLRRVLEIKDRLTMAGVTAPGLMAALDHLPFGTLLLSADGVVLEGSASALALLRRGDGLVQRQRRLGCVHGTDERTLHRRLVGGLLPATARDSVTVQREPHRLPLSLLLFPVGTEDETWLVPCCRWCVLVFDPETNAKPSAEMIAHMLEVSAAEAELVAQLMIRESLAAAAATLGISIHTARTQLKSVFAKTGLHSQLQLVRHLLSVPALLHNDPPA